MKPGFANISSMPLIECFSLLCFHHSVDVLLLFSSVHSSIHNSGNTRHVFFPPSRLFVFVAFAISSVWSKCTVTTLNTLAPSACLINVKHLLGNRDVNDWLKNDKKGLILWSRIHLGNFSI